MDHGPRVGVRPCRTAELASGARVSQQIVSERSTIGTYSLAPGKIASQVSGT